MAPPREFDCKYGHPSIPICVATLPQVIRWNYDADEVAADGIVHAVGISLGVLAAAALIVSVTLNPAQISLSVASVYTTGLMAMLILSAAYNLSPVCPRKWLLRRLDQSAIYLLIAATYTPLISRIGDTSFGNKFLLGVWGSALIGIALRLIYPSRFDKLSIAIYVGMGWSGMLAFDRAIASFSKPVLMLIAAGGALYTLGIIFHLNQRLRFQNAIWHGFVVSATACHYAAVFNLAMS
jgi:hemolysin III